MHPTTNSLAIASRKASKLLLRDFHELEMLQNSSKGTQGFCDKSFQRTKMLLKEELEKNWKNIIFSDEKFDIQPDQDPVVLVHSLEASDNLSKSLPFFSIVITLLKKFNDVLTPFNSLIIFPALHELYYAEKGGGAWLEKSSADTFSKNVRLRVSGCQAVENSFIASDTLNPLDPSIKNIRVSGSYTYDIGLFTSGKIDAICFDTLSPILRPGFELFIKEIGGFSYQYKDGLIASNQNLGEKIKQLLIKSPT